MKIARVCFDCGTPTRHGARCRACTTVHERATRNRVYDSIEWRRLRGRLLTAHVRRHGWVCPGIEDQHEPHPSRDLTLDHVVPLSRGGSLRRISDIRGEWGRRPDIVLLMQADGETRTRLSLLKRTTQKTIIATKRDGLLVDPVEPQPAGPKVSQDKFLAAVMAEPGLTPEELAARLGVTDRTIRRYAISAGGAVRTVEIPLKGSTKRLHYFPIDADNADRRGHERVSASRPRQAVVYADSGQAPIGIGAVLSASPTDAVEGVVPAEDGDLTTAARAIFGDLLVEPAVPTDTTAMVPRRRADA